MGSSSGTDLSGVHALTLGSSFSRPAQSSPFVSLRYNFQPGTLDNSVPSTLSGGSADRHGEYTLTVPSKDTRQGHVFKGSQVQQKEVDCLLIWDEESSSYKLEKLGSILRLEHQRAQVAMPHEGQDQRRARSPGSPNLEMQNLPENRRPSPESERRHRQSRDTRKSQSPPRRQIARAAARKSYTPQQPNLESSTVSAEEDDEEDGELDDLADMLVSTLDQQTPTVSRPVRHAQEDESSEDED